MTLLLRAVVVATILVQNVRATPPPGHVKITNTEHPPSYRYKYAVVDDTLGNRHGKTEVREGEQASGRYFVNSKQASTDVKYIADEWGYHPVVKYDTADDHSSASARFALGEKAVTHMDQETNPQFASFSVPKEDERELKRIIQTNKTENSTEEKLKVNEFSNVTAPNLNLTETLTQEESKSIVGNFLSANYITFNRQPKNSEPESFGNEIHFVTNYQIPITQQKQQQVASASNDLVSNISEENKLIVETAGSFGQRLHAQDGLSAFITTTVSSIPIHSDTSVTFNNTRNERVLQEKPRKKIDNEYLPDNVPGLGAYSTTAAPARDESVTVNSIASDITNIPVRVSSNGVVAEAEARIFSNSNSNSISGTTLNPSLVNYASQGILSSTTKATDNKSFEKKEHAFSKPIVVADVPNEKPFQYSTTFVCEDDDTPHTPNPLDSHKGAFDDATSSHILNSIQAGVSLVNAGETHLIGKSKEAVPAPVNEHIEESPQADQAAQLTNAILTPRDNYVGINPAFGGHHDESNARQKQETILQQQQQFNKIEQPQFQQHLQPQKSPTFEIQKSVELYSSSPSHEIHYPNQLIMPQVSYVNHQQLQSRNDQKQHFSNDANQKHTVTSQTRSDVIIENYAKDSVNDQPVYVVAPATYILEDSTVSKNNILQETIPQQQTHSLNSNTVFKSREQQSQIEMQNTGIFEHQKNMAGLPEINIKALLEKVSPVPHFYSVEKIIEKKVPLKIEKIIEKKIPVPHPFPVPVQVPVPQPIPIHIEKVIERKVPVHIPIPQIFPVEKPVHIPVPIEKIIEKPVHIPITVEKIIEKKVPVPQPYPIEIEKVVERKIPYPIEVNKYIEKPVSLHAPYGVKYGVSYQQIMKPQNHGLYSLQSNSLAPLYALSSLSTNNLYSNSVNNLNHSQPFEGYIYEKPSIPFVEGKENVDGNKHLSFKSPVKKIPYNSYTLPNYPIPSNLLHRRHVSIHRSSKPERDDYLGPVPPLQHLQRQFGFQSKNLATYPAMTDRMQGSRKSRNQEPVRYQKGNFRQSKIEYGFKPPMVPSVQYDEETASKVES